MAKGGPICIIVAALLATALNSPTAMSKNGQILKYEYSNNGLGTYSFEYKTLDGTYRKEDGGFIKIGGTKALSIRGEYGYKNPFGQYYSVRYIADGNGFQPRVDKNNIRFNDRRII